MQYVRTAEPFHVAIIQFISKGFFDFPLRITVLAANKGEGPSGVAGAASPSDAMGVGIDCGWDVVIDDMRYGLYVYPARGNIGGDQDFIVAFMKSVYGLLAFSLG